MTMSRQFFGARFAQTVPPAEQVEPLTIATSCPRPARSTGTACSTAGKIRWDNPNRAPLLLIGGGKDLIAEAKMTKAMYDKQKRRRRAPS